MLTSAGITTGIDLALYIVEQHAGPELAARVARRLVMYQRRGPQDPQTSPWLAYQQQLRIARAKALLALQPALAVEQVAQRCGFASARDFRRVWQRFADGSPGDGRRPP